MPLVVVEREFDQTQNIFALHALETSAQWCFETQRVRAVRKFGARDRRRFVCMYDAPDAESVRTTQRTSTIPVRHLWSADTLFEAAIVPPAGHTLVVAQRALPEDTTLAWVQELLADANGCRARLRIDLVGAYLARDLRRMVCAYYSPDLEAVRSSSREKGVPLESLWQADLLFESS